MDDEFQDLQRLLRLKRHEAPPPAYFEDFMAEFHRRQREELLRRPLWRLALDRSRRRCRRSPRRVMRTPGACAAAVVAATLVSTRILIAPTADSPGRHRAGGGGFPADQYLLRQALAPARARVELRRTAPGGHVNSASNRTRYVLDAASSPSSMSSGPISDPARTGIAHRGCSSPPGCALRRWEWRRRSNPRLRRNGVAGVRRAAEGGVPGDQRRGGRSFRQVHKDAVVRIEATDPLRPAGGTGFFIDPSGTIYTSFSVAGRSWNLTVEYADKKYPARCLLSDPRSGVMILKIDAAVQTPFLPFGRSEELRVASPVVAIGYPLDSPASPTFGLVAGFDQKCPGGPLPTTHVRANMPVRAGEAGAPVLNERGEVVGILAYQLDFGAVCLMLPIQAAEKVRADYVRFGRACPGWVGMTAVPTGTRRGKRSGEGHQRGRGRAGGEAGLQEGDIITKFGRVAIHRFADLRDASVFPDGRRESARDGDARRPGGVSRRGRAANPPGLPSIQDRTATVPDATGIETGTRLALPSAPVDAGPGPRAVIPRVFAFTPARRGAVPFRLLSKGCPARRFAGRLVGCAAGSPEGAPPVSIRRNSSSSTSSRRASSPSPVCCRPPRRPGDNRFCCSGCR